MSIYKNVEMNNNSALNEYTSERFNPSRRKKIF